MSSHKGPVGAQGNGAPAGSREADTVELAELGPLLEEKGTRGTTNPPKVSHLPGSAFCPAKGPWACPVPILVPL